MSLNSSGSRPKKRRRVPGNTPPKAATGPAALLEVLDVCLREHAAAQERASYWQEQAQETTRKLLEANAAALQSEAAA